MWEWILARALASSRVVKEIMRVERGRWASARSLLGVSMGGRMRVRVLVLGDG